MTLSLGFFFFDTLSYIIVYIVKGEFLIMASLSRSEKEIVELFSAYSSMVYRISFAYLKSASDAQDIVQETFIRLIKNRPRFESKEHEKAWFIRTATNLCKNELRHWWRKRENIEDYYSFGKEDPKIDEVFIEVMKLPNKYKTVVYLYYYEGYKSPEIANILKKPNSTIRNYLHEARLLLKERLGEDFYEE